MIFLNSLIPTHSKFLNSVHLPCTGSIILKSLLIVLLRSVYNTTFLVTPSVISCPIKVPFTPFYNIGKILKTSKVAHISTGPNSQCLSIMMTLPIPDKNEIISYVQCETLHPTEENGRITWMIWFVERLVTKQFAIPTNTKHHSPALTFIFRLIIVFTIILLTFLIVLVLVYNINQYPYYYYLTSRNDYVYDS